jgi:hypothetical protein
MVRAPVRKNRTYDFALLKFIQSFQSENPGMHLA